MSKEQFINQCQFQSFKLDFERILDDVFKNQTPEQTLQIKFNGATKPTPVAINRSKYATKKHKQFTNGIPI